MINARFTVTHPLRPDTDQSRVLLQKLGLSNPKEQ